MSDAGIMPPHMVIALIIWSVVGAAADTLIHLLMTRVVGREVADKLFNVSATRLMALFGVMQIARALQ